MKGIRFRNYTEYRAKHPRVPAVAGATATPPEVGYSLAPLRRDELSLAPVAGVEAARLTEVRTRNDEENWDVNVAHGHDLLAAHPKHDKPRFARGTFIGATFHVTYRNGGRPRGLEIRPPNIAVYDGTGDDELTEEFLLVNGFVTNSRRGPR